MRFAIAVWCCSVPCEYVGFFGDTDSGGAKEVILTVFLKQS